MTQQTSHATPPPPACDLCGKKSGPIPHLKKLGRVELSLHPAQFAETWIRGRYAAPTDTPPCLRAST